MNKAQDWCKTVQGSSTVCMSILLFLYLYKSVFSLQLIEVQTSFTLPRFWVTKTVNSYSSLNQLCKPLSVPKEKPKAEWNKTTTKKNQNKPKHINFSTVFQFVYCGYFIFLNIFCESTHTRRANPWVLCLQEFSLKKKINKQQQQQTPPYIRQEINLNIACKMQREGKKIS